MRWKKDNLQIFAFKKNVLRQLLFPEIVSSQRLKTNCVDVCLYIEWGSITFEYFLKSRFVADICCL